ISKYNYKNNPLEYDLIIVDETSMVDTILMNNLLWATSDETHIVFVGDPNQLASVGAGQVLYDLTITLKYGKAFKDDKKIKRPAWKTITEVQRTAKSTHLPFVSKSLHRKTKKESWESLEKELEVAIERGSIDL